MLEISPGKSKFNANLMTFTYFCVSITRILFSEKYEIDKKSLLSQQYNLNI